MNNDLPKDNGKPGITIVYSLLIISAKPGSNNNNRKLFDIFDLIYSD